MTERFRHLAKHISVILIESYNIISFCPLSAFFIGYLGRREHFRAITITQKNNRAYAEPIIVLFAAFLLWPPFYILLWISEVIQECRKKTKPQNDHQMSHYDERLRYWS